MSLRKYSAYLNLTSSLFGIAKRNAAHPCVRSFSLETIKPFAVKVLNIPLGIQKIQIVEAFGKFNPEGIQVLQNGQSALVYFASSEVCQLAAQEMDGVAKLGDVILKVKTQPINEVRALRWQQRKRDRYTEREEITTGNPLTEYDIPGEIESIDRVFDMAKSDWRNGTAEEFEQFMKEHKDLPMEEMVGAMDEYLAKAQYKNDQEGKKFGAIGLPYWEDVRFLALSRRRTDRTKKAMEELQAKLEQISAIQDVNPDLKERAENTGSMFDQMKDLLQKDRLSLKEFVAHFPKAVQLSTTEHATWFDRLDPMEPIYLEADCSEEEARKIIEEYRASPEYKELEDEDEWPDAPTPESLMPTDEDKEALAHSKQNQFLVLPGTDGPWTVTIIKEDSTTKVIKGGYLSTNRAVVIIGNLKGMVGWGMGKAPENKDAIDKAIRDASRNLIYVDRFLDTALATDCYGRHNNCEVKMRATKPGSGIRSGPLLYTILTSAGISDCTAWSVGRRNLFAMIRAAFKALESHEGIEAVARKRGKRIIAMEKSRSMGM